MFDTNSSWMQLYVNVDGRNAETGETGWYGYDFIINHKAKNEFTTTVAKYNGEGGAFSFETVGEVSYRVKDNEMMIVVPLELLGIEGYKEINVEFKIADSETVYDEMEDFYCDGDIAPLGRLNYIYQNYIPGVSEISYETDAPETTAASATEAPAPTDTTRATDSTLDHPGEGGCTSAMATALIAWFGLIGASVLLRKRKE
jgi:hypothetical protein